MHCHNPGFSLLIENHGRLFWTATRDLPLQSSSCTAQLLYLGGWENFRSHDVSAKTHWWKWYKPYQMELHSVTAADDKGSQKISLFLCLPHWKGGERSLWTISWQEVLFFPPTLLFCSHIPLVALLCHFQSEEALRAPSCSASLACFQFLLHRLRCPAVHLCADWLTYFSLYEMVSSIPLSQP